MPILILHKSHTTFVIEILSDEVLLTVILKKKLFWNFSEISCWKARAGIKFSQNYDFA